jgi:hypothetical protein
MNSSPLLSRRTLLRRSASCVACAFAADISFRRTYAATRCNAGESTLDLQRKDAFGGVLDAMRRFPLVAIGENHQLQEWHDFLTALLFHPDLTGKINDIVVEFGNALHQDLVDRFVLEGQPVANAELTRIWRYTIGGGVLWDAPVYAQFFRSVRAINWMRPRERRVRVLLGDPPFDHTKVQSGADRPYVLSVAAERDRHFARVVEREVLQKGRHGLLLAGTGHVLRGIRVRGQANAATLLEKSHPGELFVIVPIHEPQNAAGDDAKQDRRRAIARWPRPSLAPLAGTWLAETTNFTSRAISPAAARFGAQADAVLFLGPDEALTTSSPDPSLYQAGEYSDELKRLSKMLGPNTNLDGPSNSKAGPKYFRIVK